MCETRRVARFGYDPDIIERFPAVVGGVLHATGVYNDPTPPRLAAAFGDETPLHSAPRRPVLPSRNRRARIWNPAGRGLGRQLR